MINYDIYEATGVKSNKYARVMERGTVTTRDIAQNIADGSTFKPSEVLPIIECLGAEIVKALKNGYNVHIDGMGYYNLQIKGEIVTNARGTEMLRGAEVTDIRFRPEQKYLNLFQKVEIQRERHARNSVSSLTEEEILHAARQLTEQQGVFTAIQLESALKLHTNVVYSLLKRLVEEHKIEKKSFSRQQNFYRTVTD